MSSSRTVQANRIVSQELPPAHILVDTAFTYLGGPHVQLYGIAQAEQHLFVIANQQQAIQRFVWVQFEGFLPDNQRSYRYPVTQMVELAGAQFIYDTSTVDVKQEVAQRPDSDLAAAHTFLQSQGYTLAGEVQAQRFVHLIGIDKRNELMIIYGESSREAASTPIASALERALASFTVQWL